MTTSFRLTPRGPFALAEAVAFLGAWSPGRASGAQSIGHIHLAFVVDGTDQAVGVCLRQEGDDLVGDGFGSDDAEAVERQVARTLSLDLDATPFVAIGDRDPVVDRLLADRPGFRPVNFLSTFEGACWFILSQRLRMSQASIVKQRIADQHGDSVSIHGDRRYAFPSPTRLRAVLGIAGVPERKLVNLRSLADAALAGALDADHLRAIPREQAIAELETLPGIGPFSAEGILLRGAGAPDVLSLHEPRLRRAVGQAYGLPADPTDDELIAIADRWRPFRTWVGVLFRSAGGAPEEAQKEIASQTAMARAISSSVGTSASRKYPSPPAPNDSPGLTTMPCSSRRVKNASRSAIGTRTQR
jgi:DNA-3-methyladenine glycosylase II